MYGRTFGMLLMHSVLGDSRRVLLARNIAYMPKACPYIFAYSIPPLQLSIMGGEIVKKSIVKYPRGDGGTATWRKFDVVGLRGRAMALPYL